MLPLNMIGGSELYDCTADSRKMEIQQSDVILKVIPYQVEFPINSNLNFSAQVILTVVPSFEMYHYWTTGHTLVANG